MKGLLFVIVFLVLCGGGGYYFVTQDPPVDPAIVLYGNIDIRSVNLAFRVPGQLQIMNREEGDQIKAGEPLAKLDQKPYVDAVAASRATYEERRFAYEHAVSIASRKETLLQTKAATPEAAESAQSQRDQTLAALHYAQANLDIALTKLQDTVIISPSDGSILSRVKEVGSILDTGDTVYILALKNPIWARVYIHEQQLGQIYPGMQADIFTDSRPNTPYKGRVGYISPIAEFTPKTVETQELRPKLVYRVRVIIDNSDHLLRQGMPVTVKLKT